ncbi:MAG: hypothetical protein ACK4NC_01220 [Candidatus Gracilibacteria bacterium]
MPESKEQINNVEKTKGLSNILADAQNEFVKSDLDALKNRMNFSASLDSVNLKELPKENETKNFEGFQWEVVHLAAYFVRKLNVPVNLVKDLYKGTLPKEQLPPKLQLVYAKVQELGKLGAVSPVYGKVFDSWESNVTQYIQPHAQSILKVYNEDSILDYLPAQFKDINPITGGLLGGGLALAYMVIKKINGEKGESLDLGKMLGMIFGGTALGALGGFIPGLTTGVKNIQNNLTTVSTAIQESKKQESNDQVPASPPIPLSSKAPTQKEIYTKVLNPNGIALNSLDAEQAYTMTKNIFGNGHGASALIYLDKTFGGSGELVKRETALAHHEGGFHWYIKNADPVSGNNTGTFQIGGSGTTPEMSKKIYDGKITSGINYYEKLASVQVDKKNLSNADRDVFSHIGHILEREPFIKGLTPATLSKLSGSNRAVLQPAYETMNAWLTKHPEWKSKQGAIFAMLNDKSLSDTDVKALMQCIIQGGSAKAIGSDVLALTRKGKMKVAEKYTKEVRVA